jgi:hypothetical protein
MTEAAASHAGYKRPRAWTIFDFVKLMAVGFLLIPVAQSMAQEDYQFIRILVTTVTAYGAFRAFKRKNLVWGALFLATAVVFNPVLRFHMFREAWIVMDVAAAALLAASLTQPL